MKKMNAAAKFGAGAVGALALTLGATGIVGAQDADAETTDPVVTEDDSKQDRAARREARQEQRAEHRSDVADIIGITSEDLSAAREDGQSLADIAGDNVDEVVTFLTDNAKARIDAKVEAGRLTEEQAAERLSNIDERVAERVANDEPRERGSRRGERGQRGQRVTKRGARQDVEAGLLQLPQ